MKDTTEILNKETAQLQNPLKRNRTKGDNSYCKDNNGGSTDNNDNQDYDTMCDREAQTISFEPLPDKDYGEGDFVIKAVSSSALPVDFSATGACSVSGDIVHIERSGECTITAQQAGDESYKPAPPVTSSFIVHPAKLTIKADDKNVVYGTPLPVFTATISGLFNGIQDISSLTLNTAAAPGSPVGSYPITPAALTSPNYDYTYINGTLKVTPAPLTITAEDKSVHYGDNPPIFTAKVAGLINGDTLESLGDIVYNTPFTPDKSVGTYPIKVVGLSSTNYECNYVDGTLTVMPAPLTVTVEDKTAIYGESFPDFTVVANGLVSGDALESIGKLDFETPAIPGSPVAVYSIKASGLTTPNYDVNYVDGQLAIKPASLTVTAEDKSMVYGTPLPEFNAAVSGLVNEDTLKSLGNLVFTTSASESSPVGTYMIKPGGLTSPDYEYTYVEGILTITPAKLIVIVEDKSMVRGGSLPTFSAIAIGLVNGDNLESLGTLVYETTATPGSLPGEYTIEASGLYPPNYEVSYIGGSLTVIPARLRVIIEDKSMVRGGSLPAFNTIAIGLVNDDTLESLGTLVYETTATADSLPGEYAIKAKGLSSPNYKISYIEGRFTIVPDPLDLTGNFEEPSTRTLCPYCYTVIPGEARQCPKCLSPKYTNQTNCPEA